MNGISQTSWDSASLRTLSPSKTLDTISANSSQKELMKVSKQFEGIFISQLYKEMKKSVEHLNEGSTLFKSSMAENIFKDMLFDQYAEDSAKDSPLGLAKLVYNSLSGQKGENE